MIFEKEQYIENEIMSVEQNCFKLGTDNFLFYVGGCGGFYGCVSVFSLKVMVQWVFEAFELWSG